MAKKNLKSLYVLCPSYGLTGPAHRARVLKNAEELADALKAQMTPSPLLDRYPGPGAWLPEADRIEDLRKAMQHDIIVAARGGHGCMHLIPELMRMRPKQPPTLFGYSDITVLHACWHQRGWGETYYGGLADDVQEHRLGESLLPLMHGRALERSHHTDASVRVIRPGTAEGPTFAACLAVLAGLCGTPAQPNLEGHVLFIEDIDEKPYRIDFFMNQLYLAGALNGVRGLVTGTLTHQTDPDYLGPSMEELMGTWADRLSVPALVRLPFGHMLDAMALPIGRPVTLDATKNHHWHLKWSARKR